MANLRAWDLDAWIGTTDNLVALWLYNALQRRDWILINFLNSFKGGSYSKKNNHVKHYEREYGNALIEGMHNARKDYRM